jgi:hypothetical protein
VLQSKPATSRSTENANTTIVGLKKPKLKSKTIKIAPVRYAAPL